MFSYIPTYPGQDFGSDSASACFGDDAGDGGAGKDLSADFGFEFGVSIHCIQLVTCPSARFDRVCFFSPSSNTCQLYGRFAGGGGGGASGDFNCADR